jgi:hypothetical protein
MDATPAELVRVAKEFSFEGIVAKRVDSLYESGERSGARLKYRINKRQEFVIGGYVANNPIDSIIVGYYDGDKLLYAGKVRNGFVPYTRRTVASKFAGLKSDTCPFANLPEKKRTQWALTKDEMKNCRWLKPELVMVVQRFKALLIRSTRGPISTQTNLTSVVRRRIRTAILTETSSIKEKSLVESRLGSLELVASDIRTLPSRG